MNKTAWLAIQGRFPLITSNESTTALPLDSQRTDSSRALTFGRAVLLSEPEGTSRRPCRLPSTQSRMAAQAALRESTLNSQP